LIRVEVTARHVGQALLCSSGEDPDVPTVQSYSILDGAAAAVSG
jgi:hypothetical protein